MFIECLIVLKLVKVNSSDGQNNFNVTYVCIFLNAKSEGLVGLSPLFGDRRGFMPPQLKFIYSEKATKFYEIFT